MSDFRGLEFGELCELLSAPRDTLILSHARPDCDTIGSAFALKGLLTAMGSRALCTGCDRVPKRLHFLACDDEIPAGFVPERVITVDVASPSQLGALFGKYQIDIMIDHHTAGVPMADNYIRGDVSAVGEIIFEISRELLRLGYIKALPKGIDRLIYAAISSDTGCFRFSNVTPTTHRIAAELLESGLDAADINHRLFGVKTRSQIELERVAIGKLATYCGGRVSVVALDSADIEAVGVPAEELDMLIDVARCVEGADVAVSVRKNPGDEHFRVSMRSTGPVDVASICAAFGGGGHIRAAGCAVSAENIEAATASIVAEAEKQMGGAV